MEFDEDRKGFPASYLRSRREKVRIKVKIRIGIP
jgi:hypothetical protein